METRKQADMKLFRDRDEQEIYQQFSKRRLQQDRNQRYVSEDIVLIISIYDIFIDCIGCACRGHKLSQLKSEAARRKEAGLELKRQRYFRRN